MAVVGGRQLTEGREYSAESQQLLGTLPLHEFRALDLWFFYKILKKGNRVIYFSIFYLSKTC